MASLCHAVGRTASLISRFKWISLNIQRLHLHSEVPWQQSRNLIIYQLRHYSAGRQKNFFRQVIDNIQQEIARNKEMKENLRKFQEETQKLEQSEAFQKAKQKYQELESETAKSSQILKQMFADAKEKLEETLKEAQKTDLAKKAEKLSEELAKAAKETRESVSKQTEQIGKTSAFKTISESVKAVKEEIDESTLGRARPYRPPVKLRKRVEELTFSDKEDKPVTPNTEATGMELHKDSQWYQSWQKFKDNNPYVTKFFDWKTKYDESDNPIVRASRAVTDKVSDIVGGLFSKTELSEVLTEIIKMDPSFDKDKFLKDCEFDIIPNILEAIIQGNLEILKDWCYEAPYNTLATPIKQAQALGYTFNSKILDIFNVDLAMGKIMEQGPVLIISFQTQQIMSIQNKKGDIVEGDPNKILRMHYVWVLCRDQAELNPKAAWKLLDLSANSAEQWL